MVIINEWLPNPSGSDAEGEWIELFNSGNAAEDMTGWILTAGAKGKFVFSKTLIASGEYLVVRRPVSKLVLRNQDEKVSLFDRAGDLKDSSLFRGLAPDGQSFSRGMADNFIFTSPTPGAANKFPETAALIDHAYAPNVPLHSSMGSGELQLLALSAAVVVTALVLYALKTNAYAKDLFFGGN